MTKYKRQLTEEEIRDEMIENGQMDEEGNLLEPNVKEEEEEKTSTDNIDWKKRHDDGRRFQIQLQQENKQLEERLKEVEQKLSESTTVPENMEEFEEWVKEFPKVYDMVKIVARQEASNLDESIKTKLTKIDELDQQEKMKAEKAKLARLQPDFYEKIAPSEEFKDWILNVAPEWARNAVLDSKNPNAEIVSTVIDSYKVQTGYSSPKKSEKKTTSQDAASSVSTKKGSTPKVKETSEWSESRVNSLTIDQYEKYEDEINEAIQNGTFVYDMRDAQ